MKLKTYELEKQINQRLAAMRPEQRPELRTRSRVQSVAACARGFEATDHNGCIELITTPQALAWLR